MVTAISHKWGILCILLVVLVLLGACTPQEQELPFETIEQADYSPKYEDKEPGLVIIASADETNQLDGWVSAEAIEQLRELDYGNYFAVVAFLGWQPTGHEGISIEQIVRQGNAVSVYTLVGRPTGETEETSPFHLVRVQKVGQWGTSINFALVIEETTVASQSHY
jgi:hypothetical protein